MANTFSSMLLILFFSLYFLLLYLHIFMYFWMNTHEVLLIIMLPILNYIHLFQLLSNYLLMVVLVMVNL